MLRSKSLPPALPPGYVPRPRELFAAAFERRLTTVVAGPGFGKSTALGAWAAKVRCSWYTVDRPDSDPGQLALASGCECAATTAWSRFTRRRARGDDHDVSSPSGLALLTGLERDVSLDDDPGLVVGSGGAAAGRSPARCGQGSARSSRHARRL